jgi:osmoprotectant transport system ATP-binding protein
MIEFRQVSKTYPGSDNPVVKDLSFEVLEGEICVLVGPSGCGKTTTMRMVNRLIEISEGEILIDGEPNTAMSATRLRRKIGYAIQQIGLFPHRTIADNIGTVPHLLGWDKGRIRDRVDELLELVGLSPGEYHDRYPAELSGGQQQRVGVARALAADPPIMLMDEPFGAVDPITRERLQDEFLRIQEDIKKTIVFVTHDIDEAIKMGDRIAILKQQSKIAQYDTPEKILTDPADDFVADFIGGGASIKRLSLSTVEDIEPADWPVASLTDGYEHVQEKMRSSEKGYVLLLDDKDRPSRWVGAEDIEHEEVSLEEAGRPAVAIVEANASLYNILDTMITSYKGSAIVVDGEGRYQGVVDFDTVLEAINAMRPEEQTRDRAKRDVQTGNGGL